MDFVLKDPREKEDQEEEEPLLHRQELSVVPKPWERSFLQAQQACVENLHITNPCMLRVLALWHDSFRYKIIDKLFNHVKSHTYYQSHNTLI